MNLDKISVTLYDFIGYLLPGTILLMAAAMAEATFLNSHLLTLQGLKSNLVPFGIVAYYAGQFCHVTGSTLKMGLEWIVEIIRQKVQTWPARSFGELTVTFALRLIAPRGASMTSGIEAEVENELCKAFDLQPDQLGEPGKVRNLECYRLADNFVLASGIDGEREIFQAREGFFKASYTAFLISGILLMIASIASTPVINRTAQDAVRMGPFVSWTLCVFCFLFANICYHRQAYFCCLKRNHVELLFLALRRAKPTP